MEDKVRLLKKAVEEDNEANPKLIEKFDALWDTEALLKNIPKDVIESNQGELSKYLQLALSQPSVGPCLSTLVSKIINLLFAFDPNYRAPVNVVKNAHTQLLLKTTPLTTKIAFLKVLGTVSKERPIQVSSVLAETVQILVKQIKATEIPLRITPLETLRDVVEGAGLSGNFIHNDILNGIKPAFSDKVNEVRVAAYQCLNAIAKFTSNFSYLDGNKGGLSICVKNLDDSAMTVRSAASYSLGYQLALAVMAPPPKPQKDQKTKVAPQWTIDTVGAYFGNLFSKSSGGGKALRVGIANSYISYLHELKPKVLDSNLELIVKNIVNLLSCISPKTAPEETKQSIITVSHILRYGLGEYLGETGQQQMANIITHCLKKKPFSDSDIMLSVMLRELCHLILALGEGSFQIREQVTETLTAFSSSESIEVRLYSALCYRCLGTALPFYLSKTLADFITKLQTDHATLSTSLVAPAMVPQTLKNLIAVEGDGYIIGALVASIPHSKLGIPETVAQSALQLASQLFKVDNSKQQVSVSLTTTCFSIVGSLMKLGPSFVEPRLSDLFALWNKALSLDASTVPKQEKDIVYFCQLRSEALGSLASFVANCGTLLSNMILKQVIALLTGILNVVAAFPDSIKYQPGSILAINGLKRNLLASFNGIPSAASYSSCFIQLLRVVASQIADPATGNVNSSTAAARLLLKSMLHRGDAILGPWAIGSHTTIEKLNQVQSPVSEDPSVIWNASLDDVFAPYHGINGSLVTISIELFASLFVLQSEKNRLQLVEHLISCVKGAPTPSVKYSNQINCMAVILRILKEMSKKRLSFVQQGQTKLLGNILEFVKGFIGESAADIRRACCEALGILSWLEGDQITNDIVKFLLITVKKAKDPNTLSGCAFALGCVNRFVGGMRSGSYLKSIITLLLELLKEPNSIIQIWVLRSLCLTIEVAGAVYSSFVSSTLNSVLNLMLSNYDSYFTNLNNANAAVATIYTQAQSQSSQYHHHYHYHYYDLAAQYQGIGGVVHAIIHALGPELKVGSNVMSTCYAIANQLKDEVEPLVQLKYLHVQQALILFAPQTVNVTEMLRFLRGQFTSLNIKLRKAAIVCLRQLLQLDPTRVTADQLEEQLFVMIDQEKDSKLLKEVRLLLMTLLDMLAPSSPSAWIQLCRKMLLSSDKAKRSAPQSQSASPTPQSKSSGPTQDEEDAAPQGETDLDDPDNFTEDQNNEEVDNNAILQSQNQGTETDQPTFVPRWRTKVFCMECLRRIVYNIVQLKTSAHNQTEAALAAAHFDLIETRKQKGDFLVNSLSDLVSMAFIAATSDVQSMRPVGVYLIKDILEQFGNSTDPDYQGHSLLEQFQSQIASALRPAFNVESPPDVTAAACDVVVSYVTSKITRDGKLIAKILGLLTSNIEKLTELRFEAYHERSTTLVQLSILAALAKFYTQTRTDEKLNAHIVGFLPQLKHLWIMMLRDYAVLSTQSKATLKAYKGTFLNFTGGRSGFLNSTYLMDYFNMCWPPVLLASTALSATNHWNSDTSKPGVSHKEFYLMMGISMNALSGPYDAQKALLCLQACAQLLASKSLTVDEFPHDVCKEILSLTSTIVETGEKHLQLEAGSLIHNLTANLTMSYFVGHAELLNEILDTTLFVLRSHLPQTPASPQVVELVSTHLTALDAFATLVGKDQSSGTSADVLMQYGPAILMLVIEMINFDSTNKLQTDIPGAAVSVLRKYFSLSNSIFAHHADWSQLLFSALASMLSLLSVQGNVDPVQREDSIPLLTAICSIISEFQENLNQATDLPLAEMHSWIVSTIQRAINSSQLKVQLAAVQSLRTLVQTSTSASASCKDIISKYLQIVGADLVLVLWKLNKLSIVGQEELSLSSEIIRLLVLCTSLDPQKQETVLDILVPSLIGLLRPNDFNRSGLHDLALQILLRLVSTMPEAFKLQVTRLSDSEKNAFQQSVQQNVAQSQAQISVTSRETAKPAPLKLDFSKYS